MRYLRFNAPPHHTLEEGDESVSGGQVFEVSNDRAEELLTDPTILVSEVDKPKKAPDKEPFEGYDKLSAEGARDALAEAIEEEDEDRVEAILDYERANRAREAVLAIAPQDDNNEGDE